MLFIKYFLGTSTLGKNMRAVILHLSDIHIKSDQDEIVSCANSIASAVFHKISVDSTLIIIISGDIAYSGTEEQYDIASSFLEDLELAFYEEYETLSIKYVLCPGNHDCNFEKNHDVREFILKKFSGEEGDEIKEDIIEQCVLPQTAYIKFREKFESEYIEVDHLWTSRYINVGNSRLLFECVNLAWNSRLHEQQGRMSFPFHRYKDKHRLECDLRFAVMHHPPNWLDQKSYREFRSNLRSLSDFVFTGHEHNCNMAKYDDIESGKSIIVEGGVLQEDGMNNSSFGVICIDTYTNDAQYTQFKWERKRELYIENVQRTLKEVQCTRTGCFHLTSIFQQKVSDCGAYLTHSEKVNLELEDIYIYPMLKVNLDGEEREKDASAENLRNPNFLGTCSIISGDDSSGKSSLIYTLYKEYLLNGYFPLLIDGVKLKSDQESKIDLLINKLINEQYESSAFEAQFNQQSRKQKILFIDDFDSSPIKSVRSRNTALRYLQSRFSIMLFTVDTSFEVSELIATDEFSILTQFNHYTIKPFGYVKRTELIHKWYSIGESSEQSEGDYIANCDLAEKLVDTVMDKSLIPVTPLYLLILLQSQDNQGSSDLSESAQGHYYGYLLTQSLLDIGIKKDKIGEELSFAKHLAWFFSQKSTDNIISEREFKKFTTEYSDKWHSVNFEEKKNNLINSKILSRDEGNYRFRYLYNYYYLKGMYLSDFLLEEETRKEIAKCIKHLYIKKYAHTILFLAHHSSSDNILVDIKDAAEKLFSEVYPVEFNGENKALVELIQDAPKLEQSKKPILQNRLAVSQVRDDAEPANDFFEINQEQDPDNLTLIAKLNMLFKTIDILGQVLKAQYSKIERLKKAELIDQIFSAPLRSLQDFYKNIGENPTILIEAISSEMSKKDRVSEEASSKLARTVVSRIIQGVSASFISRSAQAVNSDNLKEDIAKVVESNGTLAYELIDVAISLDTYKGLDKRKLKSVSERCNNNLVAKKVLDMLVFKRLYMFKTTERDMQWLSSEMGFDIKTQHAITYQNQKQRLIK